MIKLGRQDVVDLCHDDHDEGVYQIVDEGDWNQDYKYQHRYIVFKHKDKLYQLLVSRSGSPFTDWYYSYEDQEYFDCPEVEAVEVKTIVYRVVSK